MIYPSILNFISKARIIGTNINSKIVMVISLDCIKFYKNKMVDGAIEKIRTSTEFPLQRPQRCASTNSATIARYILFLYNLIYLNDII